MEKWQWTALILCGFGLFKEFRPSESFFTEFVLEHKNITLDALVHDAYPVSTYSYLATLAAVFLITDFLRYRPIIILEGSAYIGCWIIMIWGPGINWLYVIEVLYGLACSTEVAYYTYIYAKVDRDKYQKVTSYTYSAILVGRFFAGVTAQVLVSYELMNYLELNYISLTCVSIAGVFSLLLPPVKQSIYFYRDTDTVREAPRETSALRSSTASFSSSAGEGDRSRPPGGNKLSFRERVRLAYPILWRDFQAAYTNSYVLKWSIWWAFATAGHLQIINYIQAMWENIAAYHSTQIYNGAVEAAHTLLSAILAFGVGHVKFPWSRWGETFLSVTSVVSGIMLILISKTKSLNVAYACYIIFRTIFQVTITVASSEVAQQITEDSSGLVFGINTFVALSLQTILTVIVADRRGLELKESDQFLVYGCCFALLGCAFMFIAAFTFGRYGFKGKPLPTPKIIQPGSGYQVDDDNNKSKKVVDGIDPEKKNGEVHITTNSNGNASLSTTRTMTDTDQTGDQLRTDISTTGS